MPCQALLVNRLKFELISNTYGFYYFLHYYNITNSVLLVTVSVWYGMLLVLCLLVDLFG